MQKSVILVGLLGVGLAIALVTAMSSLVTFAENQPSNSIDQGRPNIPMMQSNSGSDMMAGDTNQQQHMMQSNMGSMMNMMMDMMSIDNIMQGNMMDNGMNMGTMNNMTSMQGMMNEMMGPNFVHMGMNRFMPSNITASVGTTITWQNHDHVVHNVVGVFKTDAGAKISVRSPDLSHMDSWSYTFNEAGTFEYVCAYHESQGMRGRIVVSS